MSEWTGKKKYSTRMRNLSTILHKMWHCITRHISLITRYRQQLYIQTNIHIYTSIYTHKHIINTYMHGCTLYIDYLHFILLISIHYYFFFSFIHSILICIPIALLYITLLYIHMHICMYME